MKNNCSDYANVWPIWFDFDYPKTYTTTTKTFCYPNIYHRRCEAIEKQFKKFNIKVDVHRASVGSIEFYRIETNNYVYSGKIAKILGLQDRDVGVIISDQKGCLFLIEEGLLHDLYLDDNGELIFDAFDFYKANTCEISKQLEKELDDIFSVENITFNNKRYISIFFADESDFDYSDIAVALNVRPRDVEIIASNHCWVINYNKCD